MKENDEKNLKIENAELKQRVAYLEHVNDPRSYVDGMNRLHRINENLKIQISASQKRIMELEKILSQKDGIILKPGTQKCIV